MIRQSSLFRVALSLIFVVILTLGYQDSTHCINPNRFGATPTTTTLKTITRSDSIRHPLKLIRSFRGGAIKVSSDPLIKTNRSKSSSKSTDRKKRINFAQPPSTGRKILDGYKSIQPVTRSHVTLTSAIAILNALGFPVAKYFSLDIRRLLDVWRPLTAAVFMGGPSLSLANNIYFLISYGQLLEELHGSAEYAYFLGTQIVILSIFSYLLQFPFTASSLIASIVYVCSRINPMNSV